MNQQRPGKSINVADRTKIKTLVTISEQFAKGLDVTGREKKQFSTPSQPLGYVTNFKSQILKVTSHQEGIKFLAAKFNHGMTKYKINNI